MNSDLWVAILSGIVALIVSGISALAVYIGNRISINQEEFKSRQTGITLPRLEWIGKVRILFADLLSYRYIDIVTNNEEYKLFNKTVNLVKLYLNFAGKMDHMILDSLDQMEEAVKQTTTEDIDIDLMNTFERTMDEIQKHARIYLKCEWNRVRFESDPKNREKEFNENREIEDLIKKYNQSEKDLASRQQREAAKIYKKVCDEGISYPIQ